MRNTTSARTITTAVVVAFVDFIIDIT